MWLTIMSWARKNWLWLALALVLIAVGMRWGWKLAAKLGATVAVGGGAAQGLIIAAGGIVLGWIGALIWAGLGR